VDIASFFDDMMKRAFLLFDLQLFIASSLFHQAASRLHQAVFFDDVSDNVSAVTYSFLDTYTLVSEIPR
jgi:hypothetical protein